jgi:hypothetical protein
VQKQTLLTLITRMCDVFYFFFLHFDTMVFATALLDTLQGITLCVWGFGEQAPSIAAANPAESASVKVGHYHVSAAIVASA